MGGVDITIDIIMLLLNVSFGIFAFLPQGWVFMILIILLEAWLMSRWLCKKRLDRRITGTAFLSNFVSGLAGIITTMILNGGWSTCHVVNTPFDLSDYVGFADNYDRHPTLTYTGTVDTNALGDYPITATVTDSSGNSESWDLTITVADSKPSPQDNNPRVSFRDFTEKYAGEGRRFGIDVSTWQGNVDFNAVKTDGCSFVVIRLGYYYSKPVLDDYFRQNLENAKAAGLDVGVYLYTADNTEEGVREHARWIAEELGDTKLELPVAFDWEEFTNFQQYGMSIHDLNQLYLAFADELSKHGLKCMLYSSKNFLNNFWYESTKAAHPVWLAHFVDETDYAGKYAIWQASCYGKINGIAGDVDMNILYEPLPLE